jgi:hypothetical protein
MSSNAALRIGSGDPSCAARRAPRGKVDRRPCGPALALLGSSTLHVRSRAMEGALSPRVRGPDGKIIDARTFLRAGGGTDESARLLLASGSIARFLAWAADWCDIPR